MVAIDQIDVPSGAALPTDPARRLTTLDVLRGFAVLGILLMNIGGWAYPELMPSPLALGQHSRVDFWTLALQHVFVEGTARALFSMLFGAGVVLMTQRLEARRGRSAAVYYRRTCWLIAIGLFHAYILLWPGDILYTYGVVGLFLYLIRRWSPRTLLLLAVGCAVLAMGKVAVDQVGVARNERLAHEAMEMADVGEPLTVAQQAELDRWNDRFLSADDPLREMEDEIATRRGGYLELLTFLSAFSFRVQTEVLVESNFLDAAVAMLLGMALMKLGVLGGIRSTGFYISLALAGYAVGLPIKIWDGWYQYTHDFNWVQHRAHWYMYDVGRIAVSFGHTGLIILLVRSGLMSVLASAAAAVGRMALTNYLMQSVMCGLIFYGFGFGLVAQLSRSECLIIAIGIWLFQLILSPVWLHFFQFGPVEWVWRTLTYMRPAPMRR